jgi:hypothetical protein
MHARTSATCTGTGRSLPSHWKHFHVERSSSTHAADPAYPQDTVRVVPAGGRQWPTLVEKRVFIHPFSPQTIRSATNMSISLGSNKNVGQEALVPVQMGALVSVLVSNRD